ncbi:hypothetical protein SAMN05444161_8934 [Rhizobiales bacterium GAS191]|nr:hypothetical protein SAMN05444161_8934 [Rhizobiales bacterium GAS191]
MGPLSQAPAEKNVLARNLVERDHQIVRRDAGSRDHTVVHRKGRLAALLSNAPAALRYSQLPKLVRQGEAQPIRRLLLKVGENAFDKNERSSSSRVVRPTN